MQVLTGAHSLHVRHKSHVPPSESQCHWWVESDCFQFTIVLQDRPRPCTRQGILSTVSSVFGPLGFVAPVFLDGKSILQEFCEDGWGYPIPDNIKVKWEKWRTDLLQVQRLFIPRCYKPENFSCGVNAQLHHFWDVSVKCYGQCSYLRLVDGNQRIDEVLRL